MELHPIEKQLILYTKGHFKRIDYNNDLKYFAAELYGLYPEQVEKYSIINMVTKLYQTLIDNGYITFKLERFLTDTFRRAWREENKSEVTFDHVLKEMLAEIQGMQVKEIPGMDDIELGEVDLALLPKEEIIQ